MLFVRKPEEADPTAVHPQIMKRRYLSKMRPKAHDIMPIDARRVANRWSSIATAGGEKKR
jgi:hypothetical protein